MTCNHCTTRKTTPFYGGYSMNCLHCAAALVIKARPSKAQQEAMLSALTRRKLLTREAILETVKAYEPVSPSSKG